MAALALRPWCLAFLAAAGSWRPAGAEDAAPLPCAGHQSLSRTPSQSCDNAQGQTLQLLQVGANAAKHHRYRDKDLQVPEEYGKGAWGDQDLFRQPGPGYADKVTEFVSNKTQPCRGTKPGSSLPCAFPFIYKGKSYHSCTDKGQPGVPWCATTKSRRSVEEHGEWGNCTLECNGLCASPVHQRSDCFFISFFPGPVKRCQSFMDKPKAHPWLHPDTFVYDIIQDRCFIQRCGERDLKYVLSPAKLVYSTHCKGELSYPALVTAPPVEGPAPIVWATSGGGTTAQAVATGFAFAFNAAGLFTHPSFTAVASNSGGTWFSLNFHYNLDYFNAVTSGSMDTLLSYTAPQFRHYIEALTSDKEAVPLPEIASYTIATMRKVLGLNQTTLLLGKRGWQDVMVDMYTTNPGIGLGGVNADQASRIGYTKHALLVETSLFTSAYLEWNTTVEKTYLRSPTGKKLNFASKGEDVPLIPAQWTVPGDAEHRNFTQGWAVPPSSHFVYKIMFQQFMRDITKAPGREESIASISLPQLPEVIDVLSMSSAIGGATGNPLLMRRFAGALELEIMDKNDAATTRFVKSIMQQDMTGKELTKSSICSKPLSASGQCGFPAIKMADGGMLDKLSFAQSLSTMQQKYPGQSLRFILTHSEPKAQFKFPEFHADLKLNKTYTRYDPSYLFKPPEDLVGNMLVDAIGAVQPVPWVLQMPPEGFQMRTVLVTKSSAIKTAAVKTKTVYNAKFGVLSGTPVNVLLLTVEGVQSLPVKDESLYSRLIATVGEKAEVDSIVKSWLQES